MTDETREVAGNRWSPQEKLNLVLGSYQADNVAEYCRAQGIDRSYLYQLRREHEAIALAGWEERRPGRPTKAESVDVQGLQAELEQARDQAAEARDEATKWEIRSELQGYYLHYAEQALADIKKKDALPNRAARRRARRKRG